MKCFTFKTTTMRTLKLATIGIGCFFLYYSLICIGFAVVFGYSFYVVSKFPFMIFIGGLVSLVLTVSTIVEMKKNKEVLPRFQEEEENTPYWLKQAVQAPEDEE